MVKCHCGKYASFGKKGGNAEYCKEHALVGYEDVKNKRCIHSNCNTIPVYGKIGSKNAEYCKEHALVGYEDVKHKRCIHSNCSKQPVYGKIGSKNAEYCKEHALVGYEDVKHKRCIHSNCNTRPSFNLPGFAPEYCSRHKKTRMVIHPLKKEKEKDIACKFCEHSIHYNEEFCSSCKKYIELGVTVKRKNKELNIKYLLENNNIEFKNDMIVADGCSKKRPDFLIPTIHGHIVLEVDENQHKHGTDYSCECTRMKQIYQDVGEQNMTFIRYNPDNYRTISKKDLIPPLKREEFLIKYIRSLEENGFSALSVTYLFYDGFSIETMEREDIDYI